MGTKSQRPATKTSSHAFAATVRNPCAILYGNDPDCQSALGNRSMEALGGFAAGKLARHTHAHTRGDPCIRTRCALEQKATEELETR